MPRHRKKKYVVSARGKGGKEVTKRGTLKAAKHTAAEGKREMKKLGLRGKVTITKAT